MVMVSSSISKDGMPKSNIYPCGVCSLRVKANSYFNQILGIILSFDV